MRKIALFIVSCAGVACGRAPTQSNLNNTGVVPPIPHVTASTTTVPGLFSPGLMITAAVTNSTPTTFRIETGASCPLFVLLDPTGNDSLNDSMGCAPGGSFVSLAPNGSLVLTRVLSADSLALYPPGTYNVNVAITMAIGMIGTSAGEVRLPIGSSP